MLDFFKLLLVLQASCPILVEPVEEVCFFQRLLKASYLLAFQIRNWLEAVVDANISLNLIMRRIPLNGL